MARREATFQFPMKTLVPSGDRHLVKLCHVISPVDFYIVFADKDIRYKEEDAYGELVEDLYRVYFDGLQENKITPLSEVNGGEVCIFNIGRSFYRGRVVEVRENNRAHLVDLDTGDFVRSIPFSQLYPVVKNSLVRLTPMLAVRCKLGNIVPPEAEWTEEIVEGFVSHYGDRELHCQVVSREDDIYVVSLFFVKNSREIADHMLASGLARRPKFEAPPPSLPCLEIDAKVGDFVPVIVSYVESGCRFFVQLQSNEDLIAKFSRGIQTEYLKNIDFYKKAVIARGRLCVAKYEADKHWYRAIITARPSPTTVEVLFVDYGNKSRVLTKDIKELKRDFLRYPAQAALCELSEVNTDTGIDTKKLRDVAEGKRMQIQIRGVVDSVLKVTLFVDYGKRGFNINEYMLGREQSTEAAPQRSLRSYSGWTSGSEDSDCEPVETRTAQSCVHYRVARGRAFQGALRR